MFSRRPVKKLSTQITSWPSLRSLSQRCEPIKPAPPVTSILISIVFEFRVSGFEFCKCVPSESYLQNPFIGNPQFCICCLCGRHYFSAARDFPNTKHPSESSENSQSRDAGCTQSARSR